ncbi:MAG: hypothetical protein AAF488_13750 [Planctomycetota bacterium]
MMVFRKYLALAVLGIFGATGSVAQDYEMSLGTVESPVGSAARVPLRLSTSGQIQGLVAVVQWDDTVVEGLEVSLAGGLAEADLTVQRVERGYSVLGVVMDSDGQGEEVIGPGDSIHLADIVLRVVGGADSETVVSFAADGEGFSAVNGGPDLDNQVTVGGLSIERPQGLSLLGGSVRSVEAPEISFRMEDAETDQSGCGGVRVFMDNPGGDVEGYELSIAHPAALERSEISI